MARDVIVPLSQARRRLPEAGRIRLGVKTGRAMKSIDTFRFTSPAEVLIRQIAAAYGGDPKPWTEPKASPSKQWEVITPVDRIDVVLPPDCLVQWYEEWSGGGCIKRCDGEVCETWRKGPEGPETYDVACVCNANQKRTCEPHTRLNVLLPNISMHGVWRLETKSWNAKEELPGMVDLIENINATGRYTPASLSVVKQERMNKGRKQNYVLPKLEINASLTELAAGGARLGALAAAPTAGALPAGPHMSNSDDDVVEAEVVDTELRDGIFDAADQYGVDPQRLYDGIVIQAKRDEAKMRVALAKMRSGALEPIGFNADGTVTWVRSS